MSVIVKMEHVTKQFGGLTAVNDFCGEIEEGSIVGLIGPNGAGKTTLFNMIIIIRPAGRSTLMIRISRPQRRRIWQRWGWREPSR